MSHIPLMDARIYLDGFDLSGDSNSVNLNLGTRAVPDVTFGDTVETSLPGVRHWAFGCAGLLDYTNDAIDEVLHGKWNRTGSILTLSPDGTDGNPAYFGQGFQSEFGRPQQVGDAAKWSLGGAATGLLVKGSIIHTKASRAATGNGSAFQLGALSSSQTLYAVLQVFTATGTTLDVKVQSDDNSGFTSATDRITFTQVTTSIGAQISSVAGAITDDYWRIVYTIAGGGPYVLAVAAGIV